MLRHASRQDWVLAGGEGSAFIESLAPGRGSWFGREVQVAVGAPHRPADASARHVPLRSGSPLAVVTSRVAAVHAQLTAAGYEVVPLAAAPDPAGIAAPGPTSPTAPGPAGITPGGPFAVIGDVDDWQSRWGAIAAFRPVAELVFDGCTPSDLRALTRSRELPPPIAHGEAWRLEPDGTFARTRLPA
jgi:S-DNA-T family DNA segregation ATPase FtsK/SpoIIIE